MKKIFAASCCVWMCLSLAACGLGSAETPAEKTEASSKSRQENIYFDNLGDITPEAIEVVYNQVDMISYRHNYAYFITFVEVKNVSDKPIGIGAMNSYTLNKADGTVFEENYFDWSSKRVVEPGETVYLYDYTTSDKIQPEEQAVCVPEVDDAWREGEGEESLLTFHQVSDLQVTNSDDGDRLYMSGTLHCGDVVEGQDIFMTCVGYDMSGKPVCMFTEIVYDPESDSDVEFTMMAEVYGSVTAEEISDNLQVCAYSSIPLSSLTK